MKLCIDCKYALLAPGLKTNHDDSALCEHPRMEIRTDVSPVDGSGGLVLNLLCRVGRDREHACGPTGKLFQARTP